MYNDGRDDRYWLLQRRPQATEDQIEAFLERVAIIVADRNDIARARALAIDCV